VLGAVDLPGGLGVAADTGLGQVRAGGELALELFELGMVCRGVELEWLGFVLPFLANPESPDPPRR
jgi:hypothetical protein